MNPILWKPSPDRIRDSQMFRFLQAVNQEFELDLETYSSLHRWSVDHLDDFWDFYRRYSGILFTKPHSRVLSSRTLPGALWFDGAELNYAAHLLAGPEEKTAVLSKVEGGSLKRLTYGELRIAVARFARALSQSGIQQGDRVAGYLPNIPETVIAMLGSAAIGAVWSSCSPDFGKAGVIDRFGQIHPRLLVTVDGYRYNGKPFYLGETLAALAREVESLERIVLIPFLEDSAETPPDIETEVTLWDDFCVDAEVDSFAFQPVPFNHPLFIMYSSGTTGLPKCIVHGTGGTLIQHHKEHALHTDISEKDVVFYYTTCGWMMWNWLVSALAQKATIVLYEGSPAYPSLRVLWELIDETGITVFGTSPKYLAQNIKQNLLPASIAELSSLRAVLSTGSPLSRECFEWVYRNVKQDVMLASISGGTDIISCFMLGNPMLPVYAEEIQCLGLGMDVAALDERGRAVIGEKGELACRSPAPSMPVSFWNDPDGSKYFQAYFDKVPHTWIHGDFIEIKPHGGVVVYGRSDATLNPGGVRIGTAEIYRIVEGMEEVLDSLVIEAERDGETQIILFVAPQPQRGWDISLEKAIKKNLRKQGSPRHVPDEIHPVEEIPKTLNGKKLELTIRDMFQGRPITNQMAIANPDCLKRYEEIFLQWSLAKPTCPPETG